MEKYVIAKYSLLPMKNANKITEFCNIRKTNIVNCMQNYLLADLINIITAYETFFVNQDLCMLLADIALRDGIKNINNNERNIISHPDFGKICGTGCFKASSSGLTAGTGCFKASSSGPMAGTGYFKESSSGPTAGTGCFKESSSGLTAGTEKDILDKLFRKQYNQLHKSFLCTTADQPLKIVMCIKIGEKGCEYNCKHKDIKIVETSWKNKISTFDFAEIIKNINNKYMNNLMASCGKYEQFAKILMDNNNTFINFNISSIKLKKDALCIEISIVPNKYDTSKIYPEYNLEFGRLLEDNPDFKYSSWYYDEEYFNISEKNGKECKNEDNNLIPEMSFTMKVAYFYQLCGTEIFKPFEDGDSGDYTFVLEGRFKGKGFYITDRGRGRQGKQIYITSADDFDLEAFNDVLRKLIKINKPRNYQYSSVIPGLSHSYP